MDVVHTVRAKRSETPRLATCKGTMAMLEIGPERYTDHDVLHLVRRPWTWDFAFP